MDETSHIALFDIIINFSSLQYFTLGKKIIYKMFAFKICA